MATETLASATWPAPKFIFEVDFGSNPGKIAFQEISGIDMDYRSTACSSYEKTTGISMHGLITLRQGVFINDDSLQSWYSQVIMNTVIKQTVTIRLSDENGKTILQWELVGAWPTKITCTALQKEGDEAAISTMEVFYEKLMLVDALG